MSRLAFNKLLPPVSTLSPTQGNFLRLLKSRFLLEQRRGGGGGGNINDANEWEPLLNSCQVFISDRRTVVTSRFYESASGSLIEFVGSRG